MKTTDICDEFPDEVMVGEPIFTHYGGRKSFHGPAMTIKVYEDNVIVRAALQEPGNGRVLIVDGGGSLRHALLGDVLAGMAADNGWAGVIVNGCIRDSADIAGIDVGVMALAAVPLKSKKHGEGEMGASVSFAGITIRPGEFLYADEDGLVVSRRELIPAN